MFNVEGRARNTFAKRRGPPCISARNTNSLFARRLRGGALKHKEESDASFNNDSPILTTRCRNMSQSIVRGPWAYDTVG